MKQYFIIGLMFLATISSALAVDADSPLYNMDLAWERAQVFFSRDKAGTELLLLEERVAEMVDLAEKDITDSEKSILFQKLRLNQEKALLRSELKASKTFLLEQKQSLYEKIKLASLTHVLVLEQVKLKVPEQAQSGLQTAIENSQRFSERMDKRKIEASLTDSSPEELQRLGNLAGVSGPLEAFQKAKEAFLTTGSKEAAAKAFIDAGGKMPFRPEEISPEPIFRAELEDSEFKRKFELMRALSNKDIINIARMEAKKSGISIPDTCPDEAFIKAKNTFFLTGDPEKAKEAFLSHPGCSFEGGFQFSGGGIPSPFCVDTDGDINLFRRGRINYTLRNGRNVVTEDRCVGNSRVLEYWCTDERNRPAARRIFNCPSNRPVCREGACVSVEINQTCTDTDGGRNIYERGTVTMGSERITDVCFNNTRLREFSCSSTPGGGTVIQENILDCGAPIGFPGSVQCIDGRCT